MNTGLKIFLAIISGFIVLIGGCVVVTGGLFKLSMNKAADIETAEQKRVTDAIADKTAIKVDVSKFLAEYESNKLAADGRYVGKVVTLSGNVTDINDSLGQLTIRLSPNSKSFDSVSCFFDDAEKSELAKLTKWQEVKIIGICQNGSLITKCRLTPN